MKKIFAACFIVMACNPVWAHSKSCNKSTTFQKKPYIGVGVAMFSPSVDQNHYIPTGSGWPDDHYVSNHVANEPAFFLTGGYTFTNPKSKKWLPYYSLGLKYIYVNTMTVKGYIDQYSLPDFRNYDYSYNIFQQNLLATAKVDLVNWQKLMPYLTASAGVSRNEVSGYTENATSGVTPRVDPGFSTHTNYNFAYILGAGVDYMLQNNLWLTLEYSYNNFGTVQTSRGTNYSTLTNSNFSDTALKNKLTANTAFIGLTYYLG